MGTIRLAIERPDDIIPDIFIMAMDEFLNVLIELTPVDTGFCSESWDANIGDDNAVFFNSAEYASYLDDGWSQQAPNGMTEPALEQLADIFDEISAKYYK